MHLHQSSDVVRHMLQDMIANDNVETLGWKFRIGEIHDSIDGTSQDFFTQICGNVSLGVRREFPHEFFGGEMKDCAVVQLVRAAFHEVEEQETMPLQRFAVWALRLFSHLEPITMEAPFVPADRAYTRENKPGFRQVAP